MHKTSILCPRSGQRTGPGQLHGVWCEVAVIPPAHWIPVPATAGGKLLTVSAQSTSLDHSLLPWHCPSVCPFRLLSPWLTWKRCKRSMVWTPAWTQKSASGESFSRPSIDCPTFETLLLTGFCPLQVAEVVCLRQVGRSSSPGAEDGNRTGKDEIH